LLEDTFGDRFYPVFTPPWNRCTTDTFEVLDRLDFKVLSKDREGPPMTGYRFQEISTTLDIFRRGVLKSPIEIVEALISQFEALHPVGLLLHHKVMDDQAFFFLDWLLTELRQYPNIQFQTFQSLLSVLAADNHIRPPKPPDFQPKGVQQEYSLAKLCLKPPRQER
ncbi:MAG: hypothetical protein L0Y56_21385, partial [Nitrospira sp.]|nr:hypothetical protein [Nitrospira sp.]